MTTIDSHVAAPAGDAGARAGRLLAGIGSWITTSDHKRIGRMYIVWSLALAVVAAVCGALVAVSQADGGAIDGDVLSQLNSTYIFGLTFGVLIPLMLGVALAVVPLQIGARSAAFPRLAAAGFWGWAFGIDLMIISTAANGGGFGETDRYVGLFYAGLLLALLGMLATAGCLATTIMVNRAPGMNMRRVPFFTWSVLVSTIGMVVVLPVLFGALLYGYISVRYGGNEYATEDTAFAWIAFGVTAPVAALYALPAFGFACDVIATATRKRFPMRGIALTGIGLVGLTSLVGVSQNNFRLNDIADGTFGSVVKDVLRYGPYNLLPLLGALIVVGLGGLALKSKPKFVAALPFAFFGVGMVFVGLLANAAGLARDLDLGATIGEAAWLYIVYGAVITGLGALAYWGGKLWGRGMPAKAVAPLALLAVGGCVGAALPLAVISFDPANGDLAEAMWWVSAAGHGLMALTIVLFALLALKSFTSGAAETDDPYDGQTLEWAASTPAPFDNFTHAHVVQSAEPLLDLKPVDHARSGS
jgi:heme/copper-type cytochrome/quinol oxidase subunit 1